MSLPLLFISKREGSSPSLFREPEIQPLIIMPRKKKKPVNLEDKQKNRKETMTNFYIRYLTEVCNDPQKVWELTKDPNNFFRLNEQEINDVLTELDRRALFGEIDPEIKEKIIQGINY